ncbi:hypothetical protein S83_047967 [Arachis hypogaea]
MLTVQSPRSPPHPPFVPLVFLLLLTIAALNDQHNEESIYFGNHYCYIVKPRVFARRDSLRLSWVHHQVGSLEQPMPQPPIENPFSETLKRTRSENATGSMRVLNDVGELNNNKLHRD